MRVRALVVVVLGLGVVAFPGVSSADASSSCSPSPIGLVCAFDAEGDGVPDRVFVYSGEAYPVLALDAWRQAGSDTVVVGSGSAWTPWSPTWNAVTFTQLDAGADGSAEQRRVRVDSWLPSHIGGHAVVTAHDANGSGTPERVDVFLFHSHYGTYAWDSRTPLP